LGLMTLDALDLQITVRSSIDDDEVMYAKTLLPIIKDRHRLLVTLLIMDTLAYEALPVFLDQLMSGWLAVLASTSLILVFGEIIPSGIFTGPNQLYLGKRSAPNIILLLHEEIDNATQPHTHLFSLPTIGYRMSPVVNFFLTLLYPIAKPLGKLLDWIVNEDEEDQFYDRMELSAMVRIQHEHRTKNMPKRPRKGVARTKMIKYIRYVGRGNQARGMEH